MEPRIQYAKTSDGVSVAYAVMGEGRPIVYAGGAFGDVHLYSSPGLVGGILGQWIEPLIGRGWRLIRYDGRGMGASERANTDYSLDARLRDLEAVIARTAVDRFALNGALDAGPTAIAYAARHADRVSHLVLSATYGRGADYFQVIPALRAARAADAMAEEQWEYYTLALANAVLGFSDSEAARRIAAAMRAGMSASAFLSYRDAAEKVDVTDLLSALTMPTLVLHDASNAISNVDLLRVLASRIPNARLVSTAEPVPVIDAFLREGAEPTPKEARALATPSVGLQTILFTDVEGSTALTERLGDAKAREVLREHERITREALKAHGGSEVKTMGDGFMASFGSATKALECAVAIQKAFAEPTTPLPARPEALVGRAENDAPIRVRIGLNAGEPVAEDGPDGRADLFGTAVNMAARIAAEAQGGQILVSDVVRQLVAGKGFLFNDRGEHALKGFEDPVRVWEVRWSD